MDRHSSDIPTEPLSLSDPHWLPLTGGAVGGLFALWHFVVSVPAGAAVVLTIVTASMAALIALMWFDDRRR